MEFKIISYFKAKGPKKERVCVGLDIGSHAIKAIKLKVLKDTVELLDFYSGPSLPVLSDALKSIKEIQDAPSLNISCCGPSTVIRYVNFPKMEADELRQALKFEAQKHIPFSLSEINLDACILKDDLPEGKMLVLIAAVKKDFLSLRLKSIEEAGFKVNLVDIDSIALTNAFNFNYREDESLAGKAIALLNIGSSVSSLDILEEAVPCLSRDIHIAGNNFTQKLTDSQGIEPVLANLADEIRISFDYYESQNTSTVSKIFLSGGASMLEGLKDALANSIGIPVENWDPFKKINLSTGIDSEKLKPLSGQLAVAVGLALR